MSADLRYGRGTVAVDLPDANCRAVIQPTLPPPLGDLDGAIERCLNDPVGGQPLSKILEGRRKIVVVIPDATRGEAVQTYLPPLLRYIEQHRVPRENVTLVTATGAHHRHSGTVRAGLVGADIARNWTVEDHDANAGNVELDPLDDETPLLIDQRAVGADCLILAGQVGFHYCAGFGGGRKLIAPGLCGYATVQALHRRTLANIDASGNWRSRTGALRHNPFHEVLLAVAERIGADFALNVTLNWQGEVLGVVAGDPVQSHLVACLQCDKIFRFPIAERLPLVVASCGGWPFDVNLYQAHKAADNAFRAVQPGGTIILLAECPEGWGLGSFVRWLTCASLKEHRERLESDFEVAGHTAYALKWKTTQCRLIVVSKALEQLIKSGDGPSCFMAETGEIAEMPFRFDIIGDPNEALAKADPNRASPYYLMPVASSCLPEVTG